MKGEIDTEYLIVLQGYARGFLARKRFKQSLRDYFYKLLSDQKDLNKAPRNTDILKYTLFITKYDVEFSHNSQFLLPLCDLLANSMDSCSVNESFVALFLSAEYLERASLLIGRLYRELLPLIFNAKLTSVNGAKSMTSAVRFFYIFSSSSTWAFVRGNTTMLPVLEMLCKKYVTSLTTRENQIKLARILSEGLKESRSILEAEVLDKITFLLLLHLDIHAPDKDQQCEFLIFNCFTSPTLISILSSRTVIRIKTEKHLTKILFWLIQNEPLIDRLKCGEALNLLANLIHMGFLSQEELVENIYSWASIVNSLMARCSSHQQQIGASQSWHHPLLGLVSERIDEGTQNTFKRLHGQLALLWSQPMVNCLFGQIQSDSFQNSSSSTRSDSRRCSTKREDSKDGGFLTLDLLPKFFKKLPNLSSNSLPFSISSSECRRPSKAYQLPSISAVPVICQLFQNALLTLKVAHIEIISGLCRSDVVLGKLWEFVSGGGEESRDGSGLHNYLNYLHADPSVSSPHFAPLHLFADVAYSLISILDEKEMYESQRPFTFDQLRQIAKFANKFCFRVIWENLINLNKRHPKALFQSIHQLCQILLSRDCRRQFTGSPNFWIITDVKPSVVISEFEKQTPRALALMSKMPHIIPLQDRMIFFRKLITQDKENTDYPTTVITIERTRLIEDGYRQLGNLKTDALRGTIRVKFINEQGLDEAGIDQDGVFKEFLELTLRRVFDPQLNLFKSTSNQLLYPSSTSSIHENHLALFQFVGRMLAKAVYEGICVDVCLAPVLYASLLEKKLCAFDELATLDPELYKNLTFLKHYSEDVADLDLTFSYNEEFLGKVTTVELVTGGRGMKVINENKLIYIHKMAFHRVVKQTKAQCEHFVAGFRSILNPKWLALFSIHELQILVSGQTMDIDLSDLKRHTHYYGGFHSNHRLIKWLWFILQEDFNAEERHLFLKFVTSCSRPPLLGFAYLEPAFSIRCVETPDDLDSGDTLGSVVRGFLAIKRKQSSQLRLPTASTCFNLLKLPNYGKKSTLLEKLRYAIHAETGFELS